MSGPDFERQALARDLAIFASEAFREASVVIRIVARLADEDYPMHQAMNSLGQLTGKRCGATLLGNYLKPLAERCRVLCDRDNMTRDAERRRAQDAIDAELQQLVRRRRRKGGAA